MDVHDANILVHTKMAALYDEREPHFRPENQQRVRKVLEQLRLAYGGRLLDVGCGTGFIVNLAADLFDEVTGIDITPAMLARVDVSRGNVRILEADAAKMPLEGASCDVASAYAFFHHLQDVAPVLREIARVLRPGGCLYADLEPNRDFWLNATAAEACIGGDASRLVLDEIDSVCHTDDRVAKDFDIPQHVFNLAEYNKSLTGGIDADDFADTARDCGFSEVTASYHWYAGQGKITHGISEQAADTIDAYLQEALPLSRGLFKYLRFLAVK